MRKIVASANCKDQLTLEDGENQGFGKNAIFIITTKNWFYLAFMAKLREARIYLNLLVAVFQQKLSEKEKQQSSVRRSWVAAPFNNSM